MKILITNTVTLNGGDAAILLAIIDLIHLAWGKTTEIIVYDSQPEVARRYYPNLVFRKSIYFRVTNFSKHSYLCRIFRRINLLRFYLSAWCWIHNLYFFSKLLLTKKELQDLVEYSTADLILSTGGTYLVEHYSLAPRIFDYQISLLMKKPLVFFTQSLGPFLKPNNQRALAKIFNQALLVLLRDEASFKNLQDLKVKNSNVYVNSDVVFTFADRVVIDRAVQQKLLKNSRIKIAISVRYWSHFKNENAVVGMKRFKETLGKATEYLVHKHNADIMYISTCQGISEYKYDDSSIAAEIVEQLPDDIKQHVSVDTKFHTPKELLFLLQSFDLVISTRMHMAILALTAGTPVFPIAYEFKTQELFNRLGLAQWVKDIELMETDSFINSLEQFIGAMPQIQHSVFEKVDNERIHAIEASQLLKQTFEKWQKSKIAVS